MNISNNGINLIKSFEGCKLSAYMLNGEKYYTIGYGHTGADVKKGMRITKEKAEELLRSDIEKFEKMVNRYENIYHFSQNEFDSLVSFCYNVGSIDKLTNYGKRTKTKIADSILLYCYSCGKKLDGLVKRREKERELFLKKESHIEPAQSYNKKISGKYMIIHKKGVNLRDSPNGKILTAIRKGETVVNYGYYSDSWLYVQYGTKTGYVKCLSNLIKKV